MCTLSRGAMLACVVSMPLLILAFGRMVRNRWLNGLSWTLVGLVGVGLTVWVGRFDEIQQRAGSMANVISHPDGRWRHWRDSLAAAFDFWPLGSGFGTQRFIYRLYETFPTDKWFYHAENQYVEAFVEGGWLGLGLMTAAIAFTFIACWQLLRNGTEVTDYVIGVVGLFAISTQCIHAFFDFGLYLPANMCLLALLCGVVHGRNVRIKRLGSPTNSVDRLQRFNSPLVFGKATRVSFATAMCVLLVLSPVNLYGHARVDAALRSIPTDIRPTK